MNPRIRIAIAVVLVAALAAAAFFWATAGRETTDDAQVDAHVNPVASRVGGTVAEVRVKNNQDVEAGAVLVVLDPRDYQVALERAKAELATAEADALSAGADVPIASTTATTNESAATSAVEHAQAGVELAERSIDAATARLAASQARVREAETGAAKTSRDAERLKGLLTKDEISQQQFDATSAAADASRAALDSAKSQAQEAEAAVQVARSQLAQARAGLVQATAQLRNARTAPQQIEAIRARAAAAEAKVAQQRAAVQQAELNLQYTTITAPTAGVVGKKAVEIGQVVQAGQPLMAVVSFAEVWVTANFKETQLRNIRPGQPASVEVDAYGGREFRGHVESLAAATGSRFSLLPPENATGNFVKIVQRVPVRIAIDDQPDPQQRLRPGMSVTARVYTR